MATLRQAIERQRANGSLPIDGQVTARTLLAAFPPSPPGSIRALIGQMFSGVSQHLPWAVILCRFKGESPNAALEGPIETFYRQVFTPGTGGLVEYWRDCSLGAIDITGSVVWGWLELGITRARAGVGSHEDRDTMVDHAIAAAQAADLDPLTGFHSQMAIIAHNWAKDGAPPGADWKTPDWSPFWIDGSAGKWGRVTLTPPHNGNITAHEMGHSFGMEHDISADFQTHYADPCCIMSQKNAFLRPPWNVPFGPAVCFPHLAQRDWMYAHRVLQDNGDSLSLPEGITVVVAPTNDPGARANLGVRIAAPSVDDPWEYYLEYVRPKDWDQGLSNDTLFIRRIGPDVDDGPTPAILGSVAVPSTAGTTAEFVEPSGNVRFLVERFDRSGRTIKVNAIRL